MPSKSRQLTEKVTRAAVTWLSKPFSTMVVTELTERSWFGARFDVVAVTPNAQRIQIVEVKASRADFLRGSKNFEKYMGYCNRLFVAAPHGLIEPKELPANVGLLEFWDSGIIRLKKRATSRPLSPETYTKVVNRVVQKLIVEGSRWSQELAWRERGKRWAFRHWLTDFEKTAGVKAQGGSSKVVGLRT